MAVTLWDYAAFALFLGGSSLLPIYSRLYGPQQKTKADYVFAKGHVSMGAMIMSLARGTLGVRSFLGFPSELFYRGCAMWETLYGILLAYPIVSYVFVPIYYNLGITSVYQYLDLRFHSRLVRRLASLTYVIRSLLTMGVTVFIPCIALKAVLGLPYWVSITCLSSLSILFNILGGLKSAIQADMVQGIAVTICSVAIIIQGTISLGGITPVVQIPYQNGRLEFFNFDMDPTVRVSAFSAILCQMFMSVSIYGCQQNFVQRYCSMGSQQMVSKTLLINIPVISVLFSLSWIVGMVIYATYFDCDPLSLGLISKIDEIVPFYLEDNFMFLPGFMGLFIALLFNGSLSVVQSNLNSLATVTWEDFFKHMPGCKKMTDAEQLFAIKSIGTVYGLIAMGFAFGVGTLSGVIDTSKLMASATSGPLLGVFLLAMLFPVSNRKGAATGMIVGILVTMWITVGSLSIDKAPIPMLPLSTDGCNNDTFAHIGLISTTPPILPNSTIHASSPLEHVTYVGHLLQGFYSISYMYFSVIGCTVTVVIGILVSYITGHSEADVYDEKLLHPLALKISNLFPGKPRRFSITPRPPPSQERLQTLPYVVSDHYVKPSSIRDVTLQKNNSYKISGVDKAQNLPCLVSGAGETATTGEKKQRKAVVNLNNMSPTTKAILNSKFKVSQLPPRGFADKSHREPYSSEIEAAQTLDSGFNKTSSSTRDENEEQANARNNNDETPTKKHV